MSRTIPLSVRFTLSYALLFLGLMLNLPSSAQTRIAAYKCIPTAANSYCASLHGLKVATRQSGLIFSMPYGSIILTSGETTPLSAFMRVCPGPRALPDACPMTADDVAAAELDNSINVRAMAIRPIQIPVGVSPSPLGADVEVIAAYITSQLHTTGPFGTGLWHGLFTGSFAWYQVLDHRTGTLTNAYLADRILVKYSNGQTEEFVFVGPYVFQNQQWVRVDGTIRNADGSDPAAAPPIAAVPIGGSVALIPGWNPGAISVALPSLYCQALATICADGQCDQRTYRIPC